MAVLSILLVAAFLVQRRPASDPTGPAGVEVAPPGGPDEAAAEKRRLRSLGYLN